MATPAPNATELITGSAEATPHDAFHCWKMKTRITNPMTVGKQSSDV
jgi:hypothetical protein